MPLYITTTLNPNLAHHPPRPSFLFLLLLKKVKISNLTTKILKNVIQCYHSGKKEPSVDHGEYVVQKPDYFSDHMTHKDEAK